MQLAVLAGLGLNGLFARLQAWRPLVAACALVLILADLGWNATTVHGNFGHAWTPVGVLPPAAGISPACP